MNVSSKAVFLSYASQDAGAAKRICEALCAAGVEVWFDQSELRGGDAWDAKIRKQIKECALFVPVISAATQARSEGYFRLEWKLAVDRSHLLADDTPFLFPVVIDDTSDAATRVPDKFREVQWTRLKLEETPTELASRVAKLLAGQNAANEVSPTAARRIAPSKKDRGLAEWWWIIFPIFGMALTLIHALKQPAPRSGSALPPVAAPAVAPAASAPRSEARQLTARARAMSLDKYDSSADDFAAAESLIKRALELDSNDAQIWAVSSLLNFAFRSRGYDHSPSRTAAARTHAERALNLDPDSLDGLYALGRWQRDNEDPVIAEGTFKKILGRDPNHAGALENLARVYDGMNRVEESAALFERAAAQPGGAALARYMEFLLYFRRARFEEADRSIRQSIAERPSANSQAMLAILLLTWKGDADEAARVVASGPAANRNEARTIWTTALVQLCRRKPEEVLRTLDRFSDDYIQDNWFVGPRAYFVGRAHDLAGRKEAARLAWESGLAVVNLRLKASPENRELHLMRGELLAWLGKADEAMHEARTVAELTRESNSTWFDSEARIYALLGRAAEALPLLEKFRAVPAGQDVGWPLTPALLRLDPLWDKLRGEPGFQRLLVDTAKAERSARDWPKDAELKRAMELINSYEAITEDYALAEDLAFARVEAKPSDPEAVTVMARVQSQILLRGFDRSDERYAKAKRYSERAQQLAPDEPEALYALAICLDLRGRANDRVQALLSRAMSLAPKEASYARLQARVSFFLRPEDGVKSAEKVAALFPDDVLAQYDLARIYRDEGRLAEMEAALDRAIAIYPLTNAIVWKSRMRLWVHGDPDGMKALLDSVPLRSRGTDRVAISRYIYAMVSGETENGLEALRSLPNAWIEDFDFIGPKHMLQGELLLRAGKPELARLEFEAALAEVLRQKARAPTAVAPRSAEVWILHRLGRAGEAPNGLALMLDAVQRPYRLSLYSQWMFQTPVLLLLMGERAQALTLLKEAAEQPVGRLLIGSALKFDPLMAPWRDDPEILGLLREPATEGQGK